jgi:phosphoribosylamine--glycine ligase
VPSPASEVADFVEPAAHYIDAHPPGSFVMKADGLAGGKGVLLPETRLEAQWALVEMMSGKMFGEAGRKIVFQERIRGPELSAYIVADGKKAGNFVLLPLAQDHKRLKDGDEGPNTGGMGAYAPVPLENDKLISQIMDIGERTVYGVKRLGIDYRGVYFIGLMLDENDSYQPKVIEYNVRFGDPETQPLVNVLKSTGVNLYDLFNDAAHGSIDSSIAGTAIRAAGSAALTVCLAAEGYPSSPRKGDVVQGLDRDYPGVTIYHGGTAYGEESGAAIVNGGRVLYVTGRGETVKQAADCAYAAIGEQAIHFAGMQYRHDIGHQAID